MNSSPLPKPTPAVPKPNQTVVFDQSKPKIDPQQSKNNDDSSRIPLSQKSVSPVQNSTSSASDSRQTQIPSASIPANQKTEQTPLPPTSLSALSSMSSNKIPGLTGNNHPSGATEQTPQTTVLGKPLPQTLRGEAAPVGLNQFSTKPTTSPIPVVPTGKPLLNSTTTQTQTIKTESPNIGDKEKSLAQKTNPNNGPKIATEKSSIMKFVPFIVGGLILLIVVIIVLSKVFGGSKSTSVSDNTANSTNPSAQQAQKTGTQQRQEVPAERKTINYWGLWEPSEVMSQVITDFQNENPGIIINYVKQSHVDYRERLQTAISNGTGPDIFRFHASWVPMLKSVLDPIPASVVSSSDFQGNYYPVVTDQLVSKGQYVGLPLMYDGLVLYYNEDILDTASETPPKTWPELRALAAKLTVPSSSGIQRGGLAIGNATNVEHFADIIATLILQNGGNLSEADSVETRDALLFYTNFQEKDKVWNTTLPSSTVAFARGDVAMMFAPSWRAHEIKALNPNLKFATTTLPQLDEDSPITWASYWAEGISSESKNKTEAAAFLSYLNRDDVLKKFYSSASEVRSFGEIYPKVSMAEELQENSVVAPVLEDAVFAESWYLNSYTHDNGINDQMIEYYKTAVNSLLGSEKIEDVQKALNTGVSQVLKQYNVSTQ